MEVTPIPASTASHPDPQPTPPPAGPRRRRDIRVDRLGFVQELAKVYIDGTDAKPGIKPQVKATMQPGEVVEGDFFEATLTGTTGSAVDVPALIRMYDKNLITRGELAGCLTGSAEAVQRLPGMTKARLTTLITRKAGTPRLNVKRREGVAVPLVNAVLGLHAALAGDQAKGVRLDVAA